MGIEKISEAVLSEAEKEAKNIVETAKKKCQTPCREKKEGDR